MILFLHGLESGPHGSKYQALQRRFGDVEAPDFRGLADIEDRYTKLEALTKGETGLLLVGSSFGGLLAALMADRCPERVAGYVLCAPAVQYDIAKKVTSTPEHAIILHGREDTVIPMAASEDFSIKHKIPLLGVDDDHRLQASASLIVALTRYIKDEIIKSQ